jgi:predicted nucleotidyltransferase
MNKNADTKEFIFQRIKDEREKLAFFGVKNIGLFGSFVRGSQTSLSDIERDLTSYELGIQHERKKI